MQSYTKVAPMKWNNFDSACTYIESFTNLAKSSNYTVRTYRLDRMAALLEHFNHPEKAFKTIHLAGSKGKGSTACFIASALQALGYKTGLYVSPHVSNYRERFTVNGAFVPDNMLLQVCNNMLEALEGFHFPEETGYTDPTTFELLTLFGFLVFQAAGCSYAVIETGLGGRLDATNMISPELSIITPIELEHTSVLGDTLELIAREKAGIIKQNIPVIFSFQKPEVEAVILQTANAMFSQPVSLASEIQSITAHISARGEETRIIWKDGKSTHLNLSMAGSVQAENAALALLSLKTLGFPITEEVTAALNNARLPGRMEKISESPAIIIDGAHTKNSITTLINSFKELYPDSDCVIFGSVLGKDHLPMAKIILENFHTVIISTPGTFKKSDPEALYRVCCDLEKNYSGQHSILLVPEPSQALEEAVSRSNSESAILVTGSFYMAAEIRTLLYGDKAGLYGPAS